MKTALMFLLFCSGLCAQVDKISVRKESAEKQKCTATLAGMPSGTISAAFLAITNQINVSSACDYKITSFVFYFSIDGHLKEIRSSETELAGAISGLIRSRKPGDRFSIEKIKVKSRITQQEFSLPDLNFKVVP